MKRISVLLLALCLFAAPALAEAVNWADCEAVLEESGITGDFYAIEEAGVVLWVPDDMASLEVSDMDRELSFVAEFADPGSGASMNVQYAQLSFAEYVASVKEMYADAVAEMTVNGINAISVPLEDMDSFFFIYEMPDNYVLILICAPVAEDGAADLWNLISASVQIA